MPDDATIRPVAPFWLRRPFLVLRDVLADRDRPDLDALGAIDEPERFVWEILPHAARTFSACIALLPERAALPAAVAYLYCRMLDTYEDLVPDRSAREAALAAFAARLDEPGGAPSGRSVGPAGDAGPARAAAPPLPNPDPPPSPAPSARTPPAPPPQPRLPPAPAIDGADDRDERDRAHLLLVRRAALVDRVFVGFDAPTRAVVRDLVRDMAEGMRWSSATFAEQEGVLDGEEQLTTYCRHVLGNPVVFTVRLLRLGRGLSPDLSAEEREHSMRVGEMVQLANVTRDVEKDLRRGIAYDASLRGDLARGAGDPAASPESPLAPGSAERIRAARERMLRLALRRAPSYRRMLDAMRLPAWSVARASALLMLLFTERYFRGCARRVGLAGWSGPSWTPSLLARGFPASVSRAYTHRQLARVEAEFLAAAARPPGETPGDTSGEAPGDRPVPTGDQG